MEPEQNPWAFGREPWTPPSLEDLLPDLSLEERLRLQNRLREHERCLKNVYKNSPPCSSRNSEEERDFFMIHHARYAIHHYNAKHPGGEFDVVKPLMVASAGFRGQGWFHINFWARCRKSKKIRRFFAEVHYKKPPSCSSVSSDLSCPIPEAQEPPSSSSVSSDLPFPVPQAEKPPCSSSDCFPMPFPILVPIIETCTIIEEPLGRHRKSCAFCPGRLDILHPKGRKFVCGNDKDRMVQQLSTRGRRSPEMPFTCSA